MTPGIKSGAVNKAIFRPLPIRIDNFMNCSSYLRTYYEKNDIWRPILAMVSLLIGSTKFEKRKMLH
jgi:hypothetical protein